MIPVAKPLLGAEESAALAEVIASGWVAQGPKVAQFERAFAEAVGANHAVAVSSCTTALHLALILAGVSPGDDVVVPSLSFIATANAVRYLGARPVFADVEAATLNLSAASIEQAITPNTTAVILVHQAGTPADLEAVEALCRGRGIRLVEDAACAIGSTYRGVRIGGGASVAFSFHPRKVITTGEGGMLTLASEADAVRARQLREHGMSVSAAERHLSATPVQERYLEVGFNYRMTDLQAAVGLVQLGRLDGLVAQRRRLAERYQQLLAAVPGLRTATDPAYGTTNYQSFWVLLPPDAPVGRDELLERLAAKGVSARRGIMAAHLEPAYASAGVAPLPITERITRDSLILPVHHGLTDGEQEHIVDVLQRALTGDRP